MDHGDHNPFNNDDSTFQAKSSKKTSSSTATDKPLLGDAPDYSDTVMSIESPAQPPNTTGLPPNWTRYFTDTGLEYYVNSKTGETQWTVPVAASSSPAPPPPSQPYPGSLNGGNGYYNGQSVNKQNDTIVHINRSGLPTAPAPITDSVLSSSNVKALGFSYLKGKCSDWSYDFPEAKAGSIYPYGPNCRFLDNIPEDYLEEIERPSIFNGETGSTHGVLSALTLTVLLPLLAWIIGFVVKDELTQILLLSIGFSLWVPFCCLWGPLLYSSVLFPNYSDALEERPLQAMYACQSCRPAWLKQRNARTHDGFMKFVEQYQNGRPELHLTLEVFNTKSGNGTFTRNYILPIVGYKDITPDLTKTKRALDATTGTMVRCEIDLKYTLPTEQRNAVKWLTRQMVMKYKDLGTSWAVSEKFLIKFDGIQSEFQFPPKEIVINDLNRNLLRKICCFNPLVAGIWLWFGGCFECHYICFKLSTREKFKYTIHKAIQLGDVPEDLL